MYAEEDFNKGFVKVISELVWFVQDQQKVINHIDPSHMTERPMTELFIIYLLFLS